MPAGNFSSRPCSVGCQNAEFIQAKSNVYDESRFPARVRLREALTTPSPRTDNAKIKPPQMHRTEAPAFDISMHFY